jgi:NADPH:quinone reductase
VVTRSGRALRIFGAAAQIDDLRPVIEAREVALVDGECLVEVKAAAVNMSDVKAALGQIPDAAWPRTPGQDFAGVVVEGPSALVGKEVWGSGGDLGIKKDGTFARFLVLPASEISEKPCNISLNEAGAVGAPFVTAFEGLRRAGGVKASDNVLVLGANGKVGQAVVQLATMNGARVFAVEREGESYVGHATRPFAMLDASTQDIAEHVKRATFGIGVDVVFNTVGGPYFEQACASMAPDARQILIATIGGGVPFNLFHFFRGRHSFFGIDSLALTGQEVSEILNQLRPEFERGKLKPFPIHEHATFAIEDAAAAFEAAWQGSRDRIVIRP